MAKTTNDTRPAFSLPPADEVVDDMLQDSQRRQEGAGLKPEERQHIIERRRKEQRRREKAERKYEEQKPNRISLMLPLNLKEMIEEIRESKNVTTSQVVTFLLFEAVRLFMEGKISFESYLTPSRSPRYDWTLIHPNDSERNQKKLSKQKK